MSGFFSPSFSGEKRSLKSGLCVQTQHEFNPCFFPVQHSQFFQFSQMTFVPKAQKRNGEGEERIDPKTGFPISNEVVSSFFATICPPGQSPIFLLRQDKIQAESKKIGDVEEQMQKKTIQNQQMDSQKQGKNENFSFLNPQSAQKKREKFSNTSSFQQKSFFPRSGPKNSNFRNNRLSPQSGETQKQQQVVSITYEEIGLFPRSFNRVFDRFFKQLFFDVENFVIQEYRFYRYLFLTTVKCLFILLFVPLSIHFLAKNYFIRPITEYFWNTQNHEIFLNSYQQKKAFSEFKNFEEKIYFESFLFSETSNSGISQKEVNFEKSKKESSVIYLPVHNDRDSLQKMEVETPVSKAALSNEKGFVSTLFFYLPGQSPGSEQKKGAGGQATKVVGKEEHEIRGETTINSSTDLQMQRAKQKNSDMQSGAENQTEISLSQSSLSPLAQAKSEKSKIYVGLESNFSTNFQNSLQKRLQIKILELAKHYNEESIEAVTNFFADILSFATLWFLLVRLEIQINITKSFLLEVFFGLDDSKKSLLILFLTDLLVGYHSPNIWELFFQTLFDHYGLPESQTTIFLLVATLPVLLDVLFKYLIFRHLNRASPATVATYHAMIE